MLVPLHFRTVAPLLQTVKYSSRPLAVKPGVSFLSSNEQFFQKVIWSSRLPLDYSWHCYSYITFTLLYFNSK